MSGEVKVEGLKELADALRALPKELSGHKGGPLAKGLRAAGNVIRDAARAKVPVGTDAGPHLKQKIVTMRARNPQADGVTEEFFVSVRFRDKKYRKNKLNIRKGRVGSTYQNFGDFFYWRFLEFGTKFMRARPFLRPAFEEKKEAALQTFQTELSKAIDKANSKVPG